MILAIIATVRGAQLAIRGRAIFYNSLPDMFGSLLVFIIPFVILHIYNAAHHQLSDQILRGEYMTLHNIQFRIYWAMTLVLAIIYHGIQTIRYNGPDFMWEDRVVSSILVFIGRIVLGYVFPVFFFIMVMPTGGQQKGESPLDYKIRSAINTAERLALIGAAMFFLAHLVNGKELLEERIAYNENAANLAWLNDPNNFPTNHNE